MPIGQDKIQENIEKLGGKVRVQRPAINRTKSLARSIKDDQDQSRTQSSLPFHIHHGGAGSWSGAGFMWPTGVATANIRDQTCYIAITSCPSTVLRPSVAEEPESNSGACTQDASELSTIPNSWAEACAA